MNPNSPNDTKLSEYPLPPAQSASPNQAIKSLESRRGLAPKLKKHYAEQTKRLFEGARQLMRAKKAEVEARVERKVEKRRKISRRRAYRKGKGVAGLGKIA